LGPYPNIADTLSARTTRFTMAKERPRIICDECGNKVAHLYLAVRDGRTIQVCSECKAKGN
ncbi:MAG: hypothetical protein ACE5MG_13275, partial [Candidatus Methylomirabilales bacterium]